MLRSPLRGRNLDRPKKMNDSSSFPKLEIPCYFCEGKKFFFDETVEQNDGMVPCCNCNGSGFVPTDFGKQILSLVQHNARLAVRPELLFSAA